MTQKNHFLNGEGDQWFKRNVNHISVDSVRSEITFLRNYIKPNQRILEIGCSFGVNVKTLVHDNSIEYCGIDPSAEAVALAQKHYPQHTFKVGTADLLNFESNSMDAVYFGFCLYLTDREDLIKIVSEVNRVLKPGGKIFITDFSPSKPYNNQYKHMAGLFSFKMNYENLFLIFPTYSLIEKRVHIDGQEIPQEDDRVATTVLARAFNAIASFMSVGYSFYEFFLEEALYLV